jgi:hypothetical protein
MNILTFSTMYFLFLNPTYSKNYQISPKDTIYKTGVFEDLETLSIQELNISKDTLHLQWQKISEDIPSKWEALVCDNSLCYTTLVNNGNMNPILPGEYGFILIHITAYENIGTATIKYAIWEASKPNVKDTLTYIFKVDSKSNVNEEVNDYVINQNPTDDKIFIRCENISEIDNILIVNLEGKTVLSLNQPNISNTIDISGLVSGTYLIRFIDKKTRSTTTKKFVKN